MGAGNSTSKKEAQTNAALDFCQYLVRSGVIKQSDLPISEVNIFFKIFPIFFVVVTIITIC